MKPYYYKPVACTWRPIVNKLSKYSLTSQKNTSPQHFNKKGDFKFSLVSNSMFYEILEQTLA